MTACCGRSNGTWTQIRFWRRDGTSTRSNPGNCGPWPYGPLPRQRSTVPVAWRRVWYSGKVPKRDKEKTRSITSRMALAIEVKRQVFAANQRHKTDTGSAEVQIALLSQRLTLLQEHFQAHKKDHGSRKGLLTLVAKRRRLLTYLRDTDPERYKAVIQRLGIRR